MQKFAMFVVSVVLVFSYGCSSQPTPVTSGDRSIKVDAAAEAPFTTQRVNGAEWAIPKGMDIERYPIWPARPNRRLDRTAAANMGLHVGPLPAGSVVWNEDPKHRAFWLDRIEKNRLGWYNEQNELVYIEDCGNRAMLPVAYPVCPSNVVCPGPHLGPDGGGPDQSNGRVNPATNKDAGKTSSAIERWRPFEGLADFLGSLFWALLALLAVLALLALLVLLCSWLLNALRGQPNGAFRGGPDPRPAAPAAPQPVPLPPVGAPARPAPVAPAPAAVPAPTQARPNRERVYGPFDHIIILDAQADGVNVEVEDDGQAQVIGPFRTARTQNAGERGEYLLVTI